MLPPLFTPEQLAALSPEFQAILQAVCDHYERQIGELKAEIQQLRSRLQRPRRRPAIIVCRPSSEHPHAKPPPPQSNSKPKIQAEARRATGPSEA